MAARYVRWFADLGLADVGLVGGKNASLGELHRTLSAADIPVANGFAVTADAYRALLDANGLRERLREALAGSESGGEALAHAAKTCRELVYQAPLPDTLEDEIVEAHGRLEVEYGPELTVAVRSSATAEDLPEASFAGQHDSFLNVRGGADLIEAVRRCLASLFTDRAVQYRINNGFDHMDVALSVGVMKMVRSDLAASGVIFTLDTESGFRDVVLITAAYGLGESIVQGSVDPDELYVHKPTLALGYRNIVRRRIGSKAVRMVYGAKGAAGAATRNEPTSAEEQARFAVTDDEAVRLAEMAVRIETHYSEQAGRDVPMDIEWAKDGLDGELYIVQARPETVASRRRADQLVSYRLEDRGTVLASGRAVGQAAVSGPVRVIRNAEDLAAFRDGEVLVAEATTPDWGTVLRRAAALVTNRGGRTCHAAIVARELDIPAVVGCGDATEVLADGATVTVACCEGETGRVYEGELSIERTETDLSSLGRPRTAMMVNVGNPDVAFRVACLPNDGVGLARLEFIIDEYVQLHPMAAAHPDRVRDEAAREAIRTLTAGHDSPAEFFVTRLAEGVANIAAAFYPKPVVVRLSDFKTNEYARLLGGRDFEPEEPNPMLGFRGAARYAHPAYEDGFALECAAMRRVRNDMGLTNVRLMIPFCRRVEEARAVLDCMARHGLERGVDDLEIYVMCEIPNNVILIDAFAELFDGFSIGSNDLTQLTLGVDRDSELVAFDFDERDPGMLKMLEMAVQGAQRNNRHCGICGQAPSDYPEVAEFLVRLGIDSLSLNPDSLLATTRRVLEIERQLPPAGRATKKA
jgi:pyruvate, water dikinase